jgi:hypothetical protein
MSFDRKHFTSSLTGVLVGALLVAALPAIAASVGDPFALGEVNDLDERTDLKGEAKGANLQIKNTGNSSALAAKADRQAIVAKATDGPVAVNAKADRVAVKIKVDPGQAPIKVNATAGTATNLSADAVDGYDANQLIRAAHAELEGLAEVPDGDGEKLSVTITAPVGGMLIATGNLDATYNGSEDRYNCSLTLDGIVVDGTAMTSSISGTENSEEDCTTTGAIDVAAGTYDVGLVASSVLASFGTAALWVIFVPFDGSGATP